MNYIADLHIHSYYSRATSKTLDLEHLYKSSQIKGLKLVATGDITHPKWLEEMQEKLDSADNGFFALKKELAKSLQRGVPLSCRFDPFFILSGEISCIYKKGDKVRKVHHVVFFPSFEAVKTFQSKLERIGNIHSDGRPILGLDSRDLLELVLETDPRGYLIPAHIWTPWFSVLGSKSGFNSIQDCFEDLSAHIFAVETGLSSDPPMNWRLSALDKYNLVSNSDAHSPNKLAREANLFNAELSYDALFSALQDIHSPDFLGTIEFFPQEGKYHMDGHRKCNCMMHPGETIANNGLCPVCNKPAVLGVSYRVEELADRREGEKPSTAKAFKSLIPLREVLSEVVGVGAKSKKVATAYDSMIEQLGSELYILMECPAEEIAHRFNVIVAEAIKRMRQGKVSPIPGYDGEYGVIKIFEENERQELINQKSLFAFEPKAKKLQKRNSPKQAAEPAENRVKEPIENREGFNPQQGQAISHLGAPLIVQAGPGTGKTRTLTRRLAHLIKSNQAMPEQILAITFTNRSAEEMKSRLEKLLRPAKVEKMHIQTFHAFGVEFLRSIPSFSDRDRNFIILDWHQDAPLKQRVREKSKHRLDKTVMEKISWIKGQLYKPENIPHALQTDLPPNFMEIYTAYEEVLQEQNALDYDDLIYYPVQILRNEPGIRRKWLNRLGVIAVDEFQDINTAQYELFKIFALSAQDVFVIGDPDQAIYGFRGASREFFLSFHRDFPGARLIKLSQNYRSAQNILNASVQMLHGRIDREQLWSNLNPAVKCQIHKARTERAEAEFIVHQIEQLVGGTSHFSIDSHRVDENNKNEEFAFSDFVILLRSKILLPPLLEALVRSGIPHKTMSDQMLSNKSAMQCIIDAFRLCLSQETTAQHSRLPSCFSNSWKSDRANEEFSIQKMPDYTEFVSGLKNNDKARSVQDLIRYITESIKLEMDKEIRQKLLDLAKPYGNNKAGFLDFLLLQKEIDTFDQRGDRVHLLTLHAAKGLEFPVVFIPACEDNILPYRQYTRPDIDEERRLLYVGMTRAKNYLYLTHSEKRNLLGKRESQAPSPFLKAISESLLQHRQMQKSKSNRVRDQLDLF